MAIIFINESGFYLVVLSMVLFFNVFRSGSRTLHKICQICPLAGRGLSFVPGVRFTDK